MMENGHEEKELDLPDQQEEETMVALMERIPTGMDSHCMCSGGSTGID